MENVQIVMVLLIACIYGNYIAGSAGPVIASRLSEDSYQNVLFLEADGNEENFTEIPIAMLTIECNWNYYTIPQSTSCLGMNEKRCACPIDNILDGSLDGIFKTKLAVECVGYIGHSQLLMPSRISPMHHTQNLEISVLRNLDVGKNFQGYVDYGAVHIESNMPFKRLRRNDYLNDVGNLADPFSIPVLITVRTYSANVDDFLNFFNYDVISYEHGWSKVDFTKTFTLCVTSSHLKLQGPIVLKFTDRFEYSLIDSKLLSYSADFDILYQGIQFVLQLLQTILNKVNARLFEVHLPACKHLKCLSQQYWHLSSSFFYSVGACKMRPNGDKLQIAEASIICTLPRSHQKYKNFKS